MKIVCLANSFREGGRCLGGIELDQHNNPIIKNGRPRWIRPVCETEHEEVPLYLASGISLLDIVEFQAIEETGHGHQSENVLFETDSINVIDQFPFAQLDNLIDNNRYNSVFCNRGAAVPEYKLDELNYSLILLSLTDFETNERIFEDREYPQIKLSFRYANNNYNFPITDPSFLHRYGNDNTILQGIEKIFVTFSLAAPHNEWSYKLAAGIMFDDEINLNVVNFIEVDEDDLPF